jgi:acyl-CoA synthetase (AMP-forming)/AMP-acid ligase II
MTQTRETIPHIIQTAAAQWPDVAAVVDDGVSTTYAELARQIEHAAAAYIAAGLRPGDRVAIWVHNSLAWIVACVGAQAAGGVIVPINTRFRGQEAAYVINASRARMLVAVERFLGGDYRAMIADQALPMLERRIWLGAQGADGWSSFLEAGRVSSGAVATRLDGVAEDDLSDIMFTSGTTGDPKGAMTTHRQNVGVYRSWGRAVDLTVGDRYLVLWPFFHCSGYKSGWLSSFLVGATLYPEVSLDVERLTRRVVDEKISVLPGPPTLFSSLLTSDAAREGALKSIRVAMVGASAVPPSLVTQMREELGIAGVFSGYGLTETCGTLTLTQGDDPAEIVVTSCGKAIDGVELRCVTPDGADVPTGEPGEVIARGYNIMLGYLDDPAATAETIDVDGWFHTGDIGSLDAQGYLRITDRKKNMFIMGGFNCYPAEIEKALTTHPEVLEAAVIGIPDARMGEVGKAFLILRPGASATPETLTAWSRETMANYKVPRVFEIVEDLPRTPTGKVQKFKLS